MGKLQKSLDMYYNSIMNDINASARIIVERNNEEQTYVTRIIDWKEREISFHAPLVLGEYVRLITGKTYPFVITTKNCVFTTSVTISQMAKNKQGHFYYQATIASSLKRTQQRQYFRLKWVNTFQYKTQEDDQWHEGTTVDISAGGILMASSKQVYRDDWIHIDITLMGTQFLLNGVVLESLGKNHAELYIARVRFHDLSDHSENLIAQVIMKRQREMLS